MLSVAEARHTIDIDLLIMFHLRYLWHESVNSYWIEEMPVLL